MRRILSLFLFLLSLPLWAATGDVSCAVNADGRSVDVTTVGFTAGATYSLGYNVDIFGTLTSGTFQVGETVKQGTSLATAVILSIKTTSGYTYLFCGTLTGVADNTHTWTGQTSGATLTPPTTTQVLSLVYPQSSQLTPSASTPYLTVTSLSYANGVAGTVTRKVYLTQVQRFPGNATGTSPLTAGYVTGTVGTGTFQDGETITEASTGATGVVIGNQPSGTKLVFYVVTGTFSGTNLITGGISSATMTGASTFTAYAMPTAYEEIISGNLLTRFALSEYIYTKDNTGGGNSGTAPTFTAFAGNINNGATQSNAATNAAITAQNATSINFPSVLFQWDKITGVSTADRVKGNFVMAANALHHFGIDCVVFTATGETSANVVTATVTAQSLGTKRSATGLYLPCYQATMTLSGFTQGELIDLRAQAYPLIGDSNAVVDTNNNTTVANEVYGYNKAIIVCDKNNALDNPKYVSLSGSDSNSGTSASPYLTIGKGIHNGNIVYLMNGSTYTLVGSTQTRVASNEWVIVQSDPVTSSGGNIVQDYTSNTTYRCSRLELLGLTIEPTSTNSYLDGENLANFVRVKNCVFNNNGVGRISGGPAFYRNQCVYLENCTGDLGYLWYLNSYSTQQMAFTLDGCVLGSAGANQMDAQYRVVCCSTTVGGYWGETPTSNPTAIIDNFFFAHNLLYRTGSAGAFSLQLANVRNITKGAAIYGNVIEKTTGTSGVMTIGGNGTASAATTSNVLLINNSTAGQRGNNFYAYAVNVNHTQIQEKNNSFGSYSGGGFESITDATNEGTQGASKTGNWCANYAVGWSGNISGPPSDNSNFYNGLNSIVGQQPVYVNDLSFNTTGAGQGDYHLGATSPGLALGDNTIPWDLVGNPRSAVDRIGAYASPPNGSNPGLWIQ